MVVGERPLRQRQVTIVGDWNDHVLLDLGTRQAEPAGLRGPFAALVLLPATCKILSLTLLKIQSSPRL